MIQKRSFHPNVPITFSVPVFHVETHGEECVLVMHPYYQEENGVDYGEQTEWQWEELIPLAPRLKVVTI